jgi:uncharacterized protein
MRWELTPLDWLLAGVAALGIGVSKSGLPGVSLLHVVVFAHLFPGLASTGVVLPMLVAGDAGAVLLFRRHARWTYIGRTFGPAFLGVVAGWALMRWAQTQPAGRIAFNPVIGGIVLALVALHGARLWRPQWLAAVPHSRGFAWGLGFLAGVTTMLANAAGPVMGLYFLAVGLPKEGFVGTSAWFFLLLNLLKVPFSLHLGLITPGSLGFNALLVPVIVASASRPPPRPSCWRAETPARLQRGFRCASA